MLVFVLSKSRLAIAVCVLLITTFHASSDEPDVVRELIAKVRPSVVTIRVEGRDGDQLGIGTGFVIDSHGLIATNYHVINEGRKFTIERSTGDNLKVLAVEASDRASDLAVIRVAKPDSELPALELSSKKETSQGTPVLAFGNPLGLQGSVVDGIVSATREIQGQELIQLAMPIEPGNSGGPLVDHQGRVVGIINMKSRIDDNLGFAIPINQLAPLREKPNPVAMKRWIRLGTIDPDRWEPILGANWQARGGLISARGMGKGFGGRSLCLSKTQPPKRPFEVAVNVKLDDESGAAGLVLHSDGEHKHYGFYPSNGRLRLTCFKGATVYSWQILKEVGSEHYLPGQWNRIRMRIEKEAIKCFVNGHLVITSGDQQLTSGSIGLVKFRNTNPDFRAFKVGADLQATQLSGAASEWLAKLNRQKTDIDRISENEVELLGQSGEAASRELVRRATQLEREAKQVRQLADDVKIAPTLGRLGRIFSKPTDESVLLEATLLVAKLDNPELDIEFYSNRINSMAAEIRGTFAEDADEKARRAAMDDYLFKQNGFHGGRSEYYHPANSHLNRVIDDREGLPITLSILYMELGRRLGLKIDGVGLPGHFVVKHVGKDDQEELIDVFEGGTLMSDEEAAITVMQFAERRITDEDLRAQTDLEIVTRVLSNLMGIATRKEDLESMLRYIEAMVAINPDAVSYRTMRAQLRAMTDRKSRALEDIDWLIAKDPAGVDIRRLEQMRSSLQE